MPSHSITLDLINPKVIKCEYAVRGEIVNLAQMVILSLIIKRSRVKALVKDKRAAIESFGTYVESMAGDANDERFLKKALRGVRAIICPNACIEGFIFSVESLKGVQHVILLSQVILPFACDYLYTNLCLIRAW